jgi:hypothetical protein
MTHRCNATPAPVLPPSDQLRSAGDGARRAARQGSLRALAALGLAALLAGSACGGRAKTLFTLGPESDFLEPCDARCEDGYECISGLCSLSCDEDAACFELSTRAECRHNFESGEQPPRCEVACGTDIGCINALGVGYHCNGAFCRANDGGEGLTADFATLELNLIAPDGSPCPREVRERNHLDGASSRLVWAHCEEDPAHALYINAMTADVQLEREQFEAVRRAYADVRLASSSACTDPAAILELVVDLEDHEEQYVDAANADCRSDRDNRTPVIGLEPLYQTFLGFRVDAR